MANIYCRWVPGLENCSEKILGEWLRSREAYKDVVIATKGGHYLFDTSDRIPRVNETEIRKDLEESLLTMGLDVIDFYWLQRDDETKSAEEIMDILERPAGSLCGFKSMEYGVDQSWEKYQP